MNIFYRPDNVSRIEIYSASALRDFFRIVDAWRLPDEDVRLLLGSPSESIYEMWRRSATVSMNGGTYLRITKFVAIHEALNKRYADPEEAKAWILRGSHAFGGQSPLAYASSGIEELAVVYRYLKSNCTEPDS